MSEYTPQTSQPKSDSSLPVLALVFSLIWPLHIVGAILGHVALSQMRQGKISSANIGLAKAGMICGWVFTGLTFLFIVIYIIAIAALVGSGYDLSGFSDY